MARLKSEAKHKIRDRRLKKSPYCYHCNTHLTVHTATLDHLMPLAKGGTNDSWNLVLSCEKCNSKKGDRCAFDLVRQELASLEERERPA